MSVIIAIILQMNKGMTYATKLSYRMTKDHEDQITSQNVQEVHTSYSTRVQISIRFQFIKINVPLRPAHRESYDR